MFSTNKTTNSTPKGMDISSLNGPQKSIANMADDKLNDGNGDGYISGGKEEGNYEAACSTIFGNTFIFAGKTYNVDGSVFSNPQQNNNDDAISMMTNFAYNNIASSENDYYPQGDFTSVATAGGFSNKYDKKILFYANKWGIAPNLVKAIIKNESGFNDSATSSCNCKGLMQVHPKFNGGNLYDVDTNLDSGCRIFRHALNKFGGNTRLALMAYNKGEAGAMKLLRQGISSDHYGNKVLGYYNQLNNSSKYSVMA